MRLLKGLSIDLGSNRPEWLDDTVDYAAKVSREAPDAFRRSFNRWRDLLSSAEAQRDEASRTLNNLGIRDLKIRRAAESLRSMAERQITLLLQGNETTGTDFYTYQYNTNLYVQSWAQRVVESSCPAWPANPQS